MMSSICRFLVIFSVISNVHSNVFISSPWVNVERRACSESITLNSTLIQAVLVAHNLHRSQAGDAADMLKLVWSDQVASIAQHAANRCSDNPNSLCDYNGLTTYNQYLFSNFETFSATDMTSMVGFWANGSRYYNSTTGNCTENDPGKSECQEYKRLMWASSSEIGCGMSECFLGSFKSVVCYYKPGGTVTGSQKPYQQGTPCSKCNERSGSWHCQNDLCVAQ